MTQLQAITSKVMRKSMQQKLLSFGILHLSIFGSYARSEATKESDLDILIDLSYEKPITLSILDDIENLLQKEL